MAPHKLQSTHNQIYKIIASIISVDKEGVWHVKGCVARGGDTQLVSGERGHTASEWFLITVEPLNNSRTSQ